MKGSPLLCIVIFISFLVTIKTQRTDVTTSKNWFFKDVPVPISQRHWAKAGSQLGASRSAITMALQRKDAMRGECDSWRASRKDRIRLPQQGAYGRNWQGSSLCRCWGTTTGIAGQPPRSWASAGRPCGARSRGSISSRPSKTADPPDQKATGKTSPASPPPAE